MEENKARKRRCEPKYWGKYTSRGVARANRPHGTLAELENYTYEDWARFMDCKCYVKCLARVGSVNIVSLRKRYDSAGYDSARPTVLNGHGTHGGSAYFAQKCILAQYIQLRGGNIRSKYTYLLPSETGVMIEVLLSR